MCVIRAADAARSGATAGIGVFFTDRITLSDVLSVELHTHSSLSHDGRDPVDHLLEQAQSVGLDALAVTDHDEIDASLDAVEKAPDYGLIGIPGMEITTTAGHVLAFGIREAIPAGLSFEATLDRIHDGGGIAVVPHPFQSSRHGVAAHISEATLASADAIEVYNSRLLTGRANRKAERFAATHDLPMTAGSDAHIAEMVGQAITEVDADDHSARAILDAIAAGRTSVVGRRTPWHISFRQAAGGAKRRMMRALGDLL
jgi:predicted metal-dependent phosphoesterase TrpH